MKRLLPYFRLLRLVAWPFAGALACALVFGISSGFGLPFMTRKVFPVLFASAPVEHRVFVRAGVDAAVEVSFGEVAEVLAGVFRRGPGGSYVGVPGRVFTNLRGEILAGESVDQLAPVAEVLYVRLEGGEYAPLVGGLYRYDAEAREYRRLGSAPRAPPSPWVLLGAVLLLPITMLIRGLSGFSNTYLISYCGMRVLEELRLEVFSKLQRLPLGFFHAHQGGDLHSRVLGDTVALQNAIVGVANDLVKQPLTLIGAIAFLVYQAMQEQETAFVLFSFALIGVAVLPIRFVGRKLLKKAYAMQQQLGSVSSVVAENLSAVQEVRAFNLQEKEETRFRGTSRRFLKLQLKVVKYHAMLSPAVEFIASLGIALAIYHFYQKGVSLEALLPLIMALYLAYEPVKKLGAVNSHAKQGLAAIQRLEYVLHQPDSIPDPPVPTPFPGRIETIRFEGVSFQYGDEPVLEGIDVTIQAGEVVALVGPSGAGKSTFAKLIPRFYDVRQGALRLNGIDIREFRQTDLRQQISLVSQDTFLFDATVADNIRLGRIDATPAEVIEAAHQAFAHDFILQLEQGYETRVGERGTRLSGGQKQRIAIARAFLRGSPLLILDEATSALDSESEARVQESLGVLVRSRTVFIIAHRFSTLQFATRILVFERGRIIADGTPERVQKECGLYRELRARQHL
jgi:ATP-binding cassette, subfamily B, bacterial MsbA